MSQSSSSTRISTTWRESWTRTLRTSRGHQCHCPPRMWEEKWDSPMRSTTPRPLRTATVLSGLRTGERLWSRPEAHQHSHGRIPSCRTRLARRLALSRHHRLLSLRRLPFRTPRRMRRDDRLSSGMSRSTLWTARAPTSRVCSLSLHRGRRACNPRPTCSKTRSDLFRHAPRSAPMGRPYPRPAPRLRRGATRAQAPVSRTATPRLFRRIMGPLLRHRRPPGRLRRVGAWKRMGQGRRRRTRRRAAAASRTGLSRPRASSRRDAARAPTPWPCRTARACPVLAPQERPEVVTRATTITTVTGQRQLAYTTTRAAGSRMRRRAFR